MSIFDKDEHLRGNGFNPICQPREQQYPALRTVTIATAVWPFGTHSYMGHFEFHPPVSTDLGSPRGVQVTTIDIARLEFPRVRPLRIVVRLGTW